jgi:hypothetical protein
VALWHCGTVAVAPSAGDPRAPRTYARDFHTRDFPHQRLPPTTTPHTQHSHAATAPHQRGIYARAVSGSVRHEERCCGTVLRHSTQGRSGHTS